MSITSVIMILFAIFVSIAIGACVIYFYRKFSKINTNFTLRTLKKSKANLTNIPLYVLFGTILES